MVDADYIQDVFSEFGRVTIRRMFGGAGIYFDGTMFALSSDDLIYLKADDDLISDFEKAGSSPFSYDTKEGRRFLTSYWRLPDHLYDDRDELAEWAKRSVAFARRKAASKNAPKKKRAKPQKR